MNYDDIYPHSKPGFTTKHLHKTADESACLNCGKLTVWFHRLLNNNVCSSECAATKMPKHKSNWGSAT